MNAVGKRIRALSELLQRQHTVVRYVFVGGTAFVTDAGTLWVCNKVFGMPVWLSTAIAFAAAFVVNFGLNRVLTFADSGSRDGSVHVQTVKFSILVAVNFFITEGIMNFLTLRLHWNIILAKVLSTGFITLYNFYIYQHWVFASDSMKPGKRQAAAPGSATDSSPDTPSASGDKISVR